MACEPASGRGHETAKAMDAPNLSKSVAEASYRSAAALEQRVHAAGRNLALNARSYAIWAFEAGVAARRNLPRRIALVRRRYRLLAPRGKTLLWLTVAALIGLWELQTSALQSRVLYALASQLTYKVESGASPRIVFPRSGPWDERRGYSRVGDFSRRLEHKGYRLVSQAHFSAGLAFAAKTGLTPPQPEPSEVGLVIRGTDGDTLYDAVHDHAYFKEYEDIPPVVVNSLLYIENRELAQDPNGTANPAVDWARFGKATLIYMGRHLGLPIHSEGGSTLAVQLEKYRHSPGGLTDSGPEKLRQMLAASLRAYHAGPNTTAARRQIVLDYVNSVPLGGVPGYGEVSGLSEGLEMWMGLNPRRVCRALDSPEKPEKYARALKATLAVLCAVRAPTYYLTSENGALERRIAAYTRFMTEARLLDSTTARAVREAPLVVKHHPAHTWTNSIRVDQGTGRVREELRELLGVPDNYALDRLHVSVDATLDPDLQHDVSEFFHGLGSSQELEERGLTGERLLSANDTTGVIYSLLVCERTPEGNLVRVEADNAPGSLDYNRGTMLELGSTAKLRTLVHYLDVVTRERATMAGLDGDQLKQCADAARDPITRWVAESLVNEPTVGVDSLIQHALDREYSASPWEVFFTGGGLTTFQNFDPKTEDTKRFTVREAAVRSNNLVFIRLMRDLVAYHTARLPYDADAVLSGEAKDERQRMLRAIAASEGELPDTSWLLRTTSERAQSLRLRTRIERDAFQRMSQDWRRLGFPFAHLFPSLATAIGSSADQPGALADLMALIMNHGEPRPTHRIRRITFAAGTPYETIFEAPPPESEPPVVAPAVAQAVKGVLSQVVERGTAKRIHGAFVDAADDTLTVGGKTGTGDNRIERYGRGGRVISSRAVSRTATFVFYLEDRYYGVITASVLGPSASSYHFTSALPVSLLRDLAPSIEKRLKLSEPTSSTAETASVETASHSQDPND